MEAFLERILTMQDEQAALMVGLRDALGLLPQQDLSPIPADEEHPVEYTDWYAGESAGSAGRHGNSIVVRFTPPITPAYTPFRLHEYGGDETMAREAAAAYMYQKSKEFGMLTNEQRGARDTITGKSWMEVKMSGGGIMLTDKAQLSKLAGRTWSVDAKGYARTSILKADGTGSAVYFHRLVLPDVEIVDHINRSKLDNRAENLRSVTPQDSVKNRSTHKNNKSGFNGVQKKDGVRSYYVTWHECGKPRYQPFPWLLHGGKRAAKRRAIMFRLKWVDQRLGYTVGRPAKRGRVEEEEESIDRPRKRRRH